MGMTLGVLRGWARQRCFKGKHVLGGDPRNWLLYCEGYLPFWGLTYLIPPLFLANPIGANTPPFPIIRLWPCTLLDFFFFFNVTTIRFSDKMEDYCASWLWSWRQQIGCRFIKSDLSHWCKAVHSVASHQMLSLLDAIWWEMKPDLEVSGSEWNTWQTVSKALKFMFSQSLLSLLYWCHPEIYVQIQNLKGHCSKSGKSFTLSSVTTFT